MSKIIRVGDIPKIVRVNFAVVTDKNPDLASWLYAMPFGKMSENIREILKLAQTGNLVLRDGSPLFLDTGEVAPPPLATKPPGQAQKNVMTAAVFNPHGVIAPTATPMPPIGAPMSPALQSVLDEGGTENARAIGDMESSL